MRPHDQEGTNRQTPLEIVGDAYGNAGDSAPNGPQPGHLRRTVGLSHGS